MVFKRFPQFPATGKPAGRRQWTGVLFAWRSSLLSEHGRLNYERPVAIMFALDVRNGRVNRPRRKSKVRPTAAGGRNQRRGAFQAPNKFECTIETSRFAFRRLGNRRSAEIVAKMRVMRVDCVAIRIEVHSLIARPGDRRDHSPLTD